MTDTAAERAPLIIYTTSWCGPCSRLKDRLTERGIAFQDVDVEVDPAAADWVAEVNDGYRTVPTVRFPDGSSMTNPPAEAVIERLRSLPTRER